MMQALRELQQAMGAHFATPKDSEANNNFVQPPVSFGNDAAAIAATQHAVAICDRSHWGRIQITDADRLSFLHNQTTHSFNLRQPGQGCDTVFVTSTGRTIDLATAYITEDSVVLLVSPNRSTYLLQWMDRFIFFADKVVLQDLTPTTGAFSLLGPKSHALLEQLGAANMIGKPYATHALFDLHGVSTRVAVGSGLVTEGYTLMTQAEQAVDLWRSLCGLGAVPLGETVWERLRIEQGRPVPEHELTEDYNPLEAGLWHTISLNKGCYIGQETIARLHTYKGVKQQLWGVRLEVPVELGSVITLDDEKIGKLTSLTSNDQGYVGLAYIRTKALPSEPEQPPPTVQIAGNPAELVALPFVSHTYL
jgi:hypothetical protein